MLFGSTNVKKQNSVFFSLIQICNWAKATQYSSLDYYCNSSCKKLFCRDMYCKNSNVPNSLYAKNGKVLDKLVNNIIQIQYRVTLLNFSF